MTRGLQQARLEAFAATADPERARLFYAEVLGLKLLYDTPFSMVFDANGVHLRVQFVEEVVPPPYTVLGWVVDDLASTLRDLSGKGVAPERYPQLDLDEQGVWQVPDGSRIAWIKDRDGNTLSLAQLAR
jgi:catechol 2,3-dioxygenase-like lactoylglutathione lyase family enzyme